LRTRVGADAPHPTLEALMVGRVEGPAALGALAGWQRDATGAAAIRSELGEAERRAVDLCVLSRDDVETAADVARNTEKALLHSLDDVALLSIACELVRLGDRDTAKVLLDDIVGCPIDLSDIEDLPNLPDGGFDVDVTTHAALLYAAARRTEDTNARAALLAEARKFDVLQRVVPPGP
jgi:hypothetical protein